MQNQKTNPPENTVQFIEKEMCMMLNCSVETYRNILYKYGLAYLQWYFPTDDASRRILAGSKLFWTWFRIQWAIADNKMIAEHEFNDESIKQRRKTFKVVHDPQQTAINNKPAKVVLAELNKKEVVYD